MGLVNKHVPVYIFIVVTFCITLTSQQSTSKPDLQKLLDAPTVATTPKPHSSDDRLVEETENLINAGENITIFDQDTKDIVLVIGNTGAGKTTITKFLAEVERLEAYEAGDGILIRDTDQKISVNSTIVSKTIFPDLIIDNATNTAFYDLPGFSDTRNASVEIANAAFMKKVADHAQRVKLLFIVNYNSLRNGQTRTDFKTFLEHATDLIRDPAKFKLAMALVATKVEVNRSRAKIIDGIGAFLQTVKGSLHEVISDGRKRKAAEDLIDGITFKDSTGNYNRISYFKQPDEEGPLTENDDVMDQRDHIEKVLQNNTVYVAKSPEDFGFSVSPEARLIITKLSEKINQKITKTMESISEKFKSQLNTTVSSSPWEAIGGLIEEQKILQLIASSLTSVESLPEFLTSMIAMTYHLQMQNATSHEILELLRQRSTLNFLEQISGLTLSSRIHEWSKPIQDTVTWFSNEVHQRTEDFAKHMEDELAKIRKAINNSGSRKLNQTKGAKQKLEFLEKVAQDMNTMNEDLSDANTVNSFVETLKTHLALLDMQISTNGLVVLTDDVKFDPRLPFKLVSWVAPFERLLTKKLNAKHTAHVEYLGQLSEMERKNYNTTLEAMKEQHNKEKDDQTKRMKELEEKSIADAQRLQDEITKATQDHERNMELARERMANNLRQISSLEGRIREIDNAGFWKTIERAFGKLFG